MMPAVPVPAERRNRRSGGGETQAWQYRYDLAQARSSNRSPAKRFNPFADLPKNTRIVYKVPALAKADPAKLSKSERDLRRYMQVILPKGESPADYIEAIRAWPSVEDAWVAPEISLPKAL